MNIRIVALLGIGLLCGCAGSIRPAADKAPLTGKVRLVDVGAMWCSECVYEMNALERIKDHFPRLDISVLLVDGTPESVREFRAKENLTIPLLFDRTGSVMQMFHITSVPKSLVYGCDGSLRALLDAKIGASIPAELHKDFSWSTPEGTEFLAKLLNEDSCRGSPD